MAFSETIFLNLEGGIVQPITHVTANLSPSNVVIYDGETYRNLLDSGYLGRAWEGTVSIPLSGTGNPEEADDNLNGVAPNYLAKQATMWSFGRTLDTGSAGFTHVCWASEVVSTGDYPPFRIGTPSTVPENV